MWVTLGIGLLHGWSVISMSSTSAALSLGGLLSHPSTCSHFCRIDAPLTLLCLLMGVAKSKSHSLAIVMGTWANHKLGQSELFSWIFQIWRKREISQEANCEAWTWSCLWPYPHPDWRSQSATGEKALHREKQTGERKESFPVVPASPSPEPEARPVATPGVPMAFALASSNWVSSLTTEDSN